MWYVAKALQMIGMAQVLIGLFIGISSDDLRTEMKIAFIGIVIFGVGRLLEIKFGKK